MGGEERGGGLTHRDLEGCGGRLSDTGGGEKKKSEKRTKEKTLEST